MTKEAISNLFPEINEIQSNSLREKTVRAFEIALEQGGWNETSALRAPVTLNWHGCRVTLVEHIRDVTSLAMINHYHLSKYFIQNNTQIDRDTIICGALLHDLGKFTEFTMEDGVLRYSDNHNLMRHPLSGAIMAAMAGLPDKIVHLIAVHSFEGDRSYQTHESMFLRKIDNFVFENGICGLKKISKEEK